MSKLSGKEVDPSPSDSGPVERRSDGRSVAMRRWHLEQALASTRLEGHVPTADFLADCEAMITGQLTADEVRARVILRAKDADASAMGTPRE